MLKLTKWSRKTKLDEEIDTLLDNMKSMDPIGNKYEIAVKRLSELVDARAVSQRKPISSDTLAVVIGNLIGIGIILNFEKLNVVSSKAIGFVLKGRV